MDTALLIADLNRIYGWDLAPAGPERPERPTAEDTPPAGPSPATGPSPEAVGPGLPSPEDALETQLAEKINTLIQRDFGALVQLLYRIDVPEQKLRRMLEANSGEDAGRLIARLIMERQWQKIESRRKYKDGFSPSEEERW